MTPSREQVESAVAALLELGLPPEALSDLVALVGRRLDAERPGRVVLVLHVGRRTLAGAEVHEERHYPARQVLARAGG